MLSNIKGLDFINKIDISKIASGVGSLLAILFIAGIVGGLLILILWWRKEKALYTQKIHFFEEVNGQMIPIEDVMGAELTVPNTAIRIFYIKSKDLYMPRGTKKMGKRAYWYAIRNNREIVNFTIKNINEEMQQAGLDYDHTDMRYAHANLREIIKRNYKDKAKKWWQEYKDVIGMVIYVFIFTLAFYFLISQIGGLIDKLGPIGESLVRASDHCLGSSGIKPTG